MATKKAEEVATLDLATMNVWAKLLAVRSEFYEVGTKKSGKNLHAEFMYFELEDIVPIAEPLFKKYGLLLVPSFTDGNATARIVNVDNAEEHIDFVIPLIFISEPGKFRMNEVQGVGAVVTYYRRYLYMVVLDLVESDGFDNQNNKKISEETPAPAPKPIKPVTTEERKAIKEELVAENVPADEADIKLLKGLLKKLVELDPKNEEFVQSVVVKTEKFTNLTDKTCTAFIDGVKEMIMKIEGV